MHIETVKSYNDKCATRKCKRIESEFNNSEDNRNNDTTICTAVF